MLTPDMTTEEAMALIVSALDALTHRRVCLGHQTAFAMPVTLLAQALAQLKESGGNVNTTAMREQLEHYGVDLPPVPSPSDTTPCSGQEEIEGSRSWRRSSWNRVPDAISEVIRAKFRQGWSKSQIAREFRLNRRTVIRICAER